MGENPKTQKESQKKAEKLQFFLYSLHDIEQPQQQQRKRNRTCEVLFEHCKIQVRFVTTTIATFFNARKHLTQEEEQNQLLVVTTNTQLFFVLVANFRHFEKNIL
jgi:hypothetical protein